MPQNVMKVTQSHTKTDEEKHHELRQEEECGRIDSK